MKEEQNTEIHLTFCLHLLRGAKRHYYNDLDLSNVTYNIKCWKTTRLLFANKIKVKNKITLD